MKKKYQDKVVEVNKWNMPAFMNEERLFPVGGSLVTNNAPGSSLYQNSSNFFGTSSLSNPNAPQIDWNSGSQSAMALGQTNSMISSFGSDNPVDVNQSNQMLSSQLGGSAGKAASGMGGKGNFWMSMLKGAAQVGSTPFTVDGIEYKRGVYDATDPFYKAGNTTFGDGSKGHKENKIGNALSDQGVNLFQSSVQNGDVYGMLAGAVFKSAGDFVNNAWGMAYNDKAIEQVESNTKQGRAFGNAIGQATTNNDLLDASGYMASNSGYKAGDLVKGGVWKKGSARRAGQRYENKEKSAIAYQNEAFKRMADQLDRENDDAVMRNWISAYGGPLHKKYDLGGPIVLAPVEQNNDSNMSAVNYDLMTNLFENRKHSGQNTGQTPNMLMGTPNSLFAIGGDMQTNGADYGTGLIHIDAGGSHEESPYDGVQMGVDSEGTPNLVEEKETVYNDYVFSNRIQADESTRQMFKLPKKKDITFAEISKKLEKEIAERPNDPISQAGFKAQMQQLEEQQERQKQEMEAERAKAAFEALSPEEQAAVMQEVSARENLAAQEQAAQEQAMQEAAMQQPSPEEMVMMQQQQMAAQGQPEVMPQEQMAYGGNLFKDGGALEWIRKTYPTIPEGNAKAIAAVMEKRKKPIGYRGTNQQDVVYDYQAIYDSMFGSKHKKIGEHNKKIFEGLVADGMPRRLAFGMAYPEKLSYPFEGGKYAKEHTAARNAAHTELVRNYKASKATQTPQASQAASNKKNETARVPVMDWNSIETPYYQPTAVNATEVPKQASAPVKETTAPQGSEEVYFDDATKASAAQSRQRAATASSRPVVTAAPVNSNAKGDIVAHKYDWYRNGSDGYSQPWGFTVGENGLIADKDYTDDYRNLVSTLGAKDIKDWAVKHPEDASLQSFLSRNYDGSLDAFVADDKFTDDMWRKGATDGKYGFMHHVASEFGKDVNIPTVTEEDLIKAVTGEPANSGNVYHALEGDDDYIQGKLDPNIGPETRRVTLPNGDTVIYHDRGNIKNTPIDTQYTVDSNTQTGKNYAPILANEDLRYAGLLGPIVGLGMMAAGVGKPKTKQLDAVLDAYDNRGAAMADYKPIGDYLAYRPMDIWYEQNRLNANSRATDRQIMNSGVNQGAKVAGLLASGYNDQLASGNLYRNALEYNNNLRERTAAFNRGTNQFNAEAYNRAALANAQTKNADRAARANLAMQVAAQKMDADAGWYNSLYGNVGSLFKGIASIGNENKRDNMINWLMSKDYFGTVDPNDPYIKGRIKEVSAKGGKIRKKHDIIL